MENRKIELTENEPTVSFATVLTDTVVVGWVDLNTVQIEFWLHGEAREGKPKIVQITLT